MVHARVFDRSRLTRREATALVHVATGTFPARRFNLDSLAGKFGVNREQWYRVLSTLMEYELIDCEPPVRLGRDFSAPTYGLTQLGDILYAGNREALEEFATGLQSTP